MVTITMKGPPCYWMAIFGLTLRCDVSYPFIVPVFVLGPMCSFGLFCLNNNLPWQAAWHKGHPLAQTVFSCIYLLRPDRTSSHALLHSYCRVIRATCKAVVSVVSDARTHEVKYSNNPLYFHFKKNFIHFIFFYYFKLIIILQCS